MSWRWLLGLSALSFAGSAGLVLLVGGYGVVVEVFFQ